MRASSLSQPAVIDLLSRYFVPVLFSVDGYGDPPRERAEDEERRHGERHDYLCPQGDPLPPPPSHLSESRLSFKVPVRYGKPGQR